MKRTIEDFQKVIESKNIKKWSIHECSFCDYPCGFIFREGNVFYDSGCNCSFRDFRDSDYEEVLEHYECQKHPEVIKKMNEFWGFESKESL